MNEFGKRTDEELAELLYGSRTSGSKLPPTEGSGPVTEEEPEAAGEPEAAIEGDPEVEELVEPEEADDEGEWRENADGSALRFVRKTGATDLIDQDGPLMEFLEKDTDRLDDELKEKERQAEENWRKI